MIIRNAKPASYVANCAELFGERASFAASLFQQSIAVRARTPDTSPLVALFADWETRLRAHLLRHWREKASRLIMRLSIDHNVKAIDDVLKDAEWWDEWKGGYLGFLMSYIQDATQLGSDAGIEVLETTWALGVDADVANPHVADWARRHAGQLSKGLTKTDKKLLRSNLAQWVESHEDFPSLVKRVNSFIVNERRARSIAVTESTGAYAEGNLIGWRASEVVTGKIWRTANDEKVCPICGPLHGQIAALDGDVWQNRKKPDLNVGLFIGAPPAHVNCRCWLAPAVVKIE